ncbi:MAG: hypothetical protein RLZ98_1267 [Pseudomonadota bacterium]
MTTGQEPGRLALIIGNGNYRSAPRLRNPINDANKLSDSLAALGFQVRKELDVDGEQFQRVIGQFIGEIGRSRAAGGEPVAVFFFAGHGVQVRGENYLLPIDGDIANEADLKLRTISLNVVVEAMGNSAQTSIVFLDCCRNNPLPPSLGQDELSRTIKAQSGLANVDVPNGAFIAFATQPDNVAVDGKGENSPFTEALTECIARPDESISEVMIHVRRLVHQKTGGRQIPWDRSALFENFAFCLQNVADIRALDAPTAAELEARREEEYWSLLQNSTNPALLESFAQQFPKSPRREEALARIERLHRQQRRHRITLRAASVVLIFATLFAAWVGGNWARFTQNYEGVDLSRADLIGGDVHLAAQGVGDTPTSCRLRCIWSNMLGTPCVAVSYDPRSTVCYLKDSVGFFSLPDQDGLGSDPSQSWIMKWTGEPKPQHAKGAGFAVLFNRQLVGTQIDEAKVLAHPLTAKEIEVYGAKNKRRWEAARSVNPGLAEPKLQINRLDQRTGRMIWRFRGIPCQRICAALGPDCMGFSHTPFGNRCELFGTVTDIIREGNGKHVSIPTTISGCKDFTVRACREDG